MPSLADQYLDDTAAPEALRLWGVAVTLRRGTQSTTTTAECGRPVAATIDTDGLPLDYEAREWTIAKAAYVFGGVAREPQRNDRIVDGDGTWQVLPDEGKPAVTSSGDDWIIRTKKVVLD